MAAPLSLVSSALLFLLLCVYRGQAIRVDHGFRVVRVEALIPASTCSGPSSKAAGENHLKIVHRHGACSVSRSGSPQPLRSLARDALRVASLQNRVRRAKESRQSTASGLQNSLVTLPAKSGAVVGSGDYVVTVGFGTPKRDQIVIFDTGSSVCWIQCQPCFGSCYKQQQPIFDPARSSSYRNVSCGSDPCSNLDNSGCFGGTCVYSVHYGDDSSTVGFLATETLTLSPDVVFPKFVFGCGEQNRGLFKGVAGLIGLARDAYSLVSQASISLGDVFSYCLPPSSSSTGHLTIGKSTASPVVYTPMVSDAPEPTLYFINLLGISVAGRRLPVPSTDFNSGGTIIDSGTVITRLPPSAYDALRSAFRGAMSRYKRVPGISILDTCYDFSGVKKVSYPVITLHYDGADVPLESAGVFITLEESQVCLAFTGNDDPSNVGIIGNVQQRGMEVIYDIGARKVGFAAGACH